MQEFTTHSHQDIKKTNMDRYMVRDWHKFLAAGRHLLLIGKWQDAIPLYEQSFNLAVTLLWASNCKNSAVKSYVRTSLEYLYILKKTQKESADYFFNNTHKILGHYISHEAAHGLLQPLRDVLHAEDEVADSWMNQLFSQDAEVRKSLH
jgi:hypothetical protein